MNCADFNSLAERSQKILLDSALLANSLRRGAFRSMKRGAGIEFSNLREYAFGEDAEKIDWSATARLGRPFVREFCEERDMDVFVIADCSNSMQSDFSQISKRERALEIALLFCFACEKISASAGFAAFSGKIDLFSRAESGKSRILSLVAEICSLCKKSFSQGSALEKACEICGNSLKNRAMIVVASDFRIAGWRDVLGRLAARHDVLAARLCESADFEIPAVGTARFFDSERGEKIIFPTSSARFKKMWKAAAKARSAAFKRDCNERNIFPLEIFSHSDPAPILADFFASRRKWT